MSILMFPTRECRRGESWGKGSYRRALAEKKQKFGGVPWVRNQGFIGFHDSRGVYWRTDECVEGLVGGGCCETRVRPETGEESETSLPKERSFQEALDLLVEGVTGKDYTKLIFGLKVIKSIKEFPESSLKIYVDFLITHFREEIPQWISERIAEFVPMIIYKLEKHDFIEASPKIEELKTEIKKNIFGGPELEFFLDYTLLIISDLQKMKKIDSNLEEILKIGSAFYSGDCLKNAILDPLDMKISKYLMENQLKTQKVCRVQILVLKIINSEFLDLEELTQLIEIGSNGDKFTKSLVLYAIKNVLVKSSSEQVFQSSISFVFKMCQDYDVQSIALRICYELCNLLCFKEDLNEFLNDKREFIMNHADLVAKNLLIKEDKISGYLKSFKHNWKAFNGVSRKRMIEILDSFNQEVTGDLKYLDLRVNGEDKTLNKTVNEFLDSKVHRILLITGPVGIGKTTFCKKLMIELQNQEILPLYLNLASSDSVSVNLIEEVFKFNKVHPDQEIIHFRTLLFILDDYSSQMGNIIETNSLFERYPNTKLIVTFQSQNSVNTSSLLTYEHGVPNTEERTVAHINPFSCEDIEKLMENTGNSEMSYLVRSDSCIQDLFSVPVHLSMCLTHPNIMDNFIRAPKRSRTVLYTNYFTERKSLEPESTDALPYNNQIFSDYMISQKIKAILEEDVSIVDSLLNKAPVSKNTILLILDFLNKDHEKKLLEIVYSSRSLPELSMAASNALTILNKSNFSFIGKNFSKVQAPYADLSFSNFTRTDFSGSNLRNASFQKSMMTFANFWHCDLMLAELGEWPSLRGHNAPVTAVALSASFIVSASRDKTIKIWDTNTSQNIRTFNEQKGYSRTVAICHTGAIIASGSGDSSIKIWEKNQVKFVLKGHKGYISAIEFSPNGKYLVSGSYDKRVMLWDLTAQKQVYELKGHSGYIKSVVFAPNGIYFASGGSDDAICIWISMTGVQTHKLDSLAGCLKFTPDSKLLISGGGDGWLRFWDVASGEMSTEIESEAPIKSLACSSDGRKVITGSPEGLIYIWDFETRRLTRTLPGHSGSVTSLSVYKHMMASGSQDCTIKVWDLSELDDLTETLSHSEAVTCLSASADGRLIVSGSKDCTIKIWNLKKGRLLHTFKGHSDPIHSVCFSPDSKTLASGSTDSTIIWNLQSKQVQATLEHSSRSLFFSAGGDFLACAGESIKIWELSTNQVVREIDGHAGQINSVVYCSNDEFIVSGSADCTIKVWRSDTGSLVNTLTGHTKEVNSICVTKNLRYIVSGSSDYTVKIWLFESGQLKFSLNINLASVHYVSLSPDDLHLTAAHSDNSVSSWEIETGELVKAIRAHTDAIYSTVYSTDGRFLITASADSSVKVWDLLCEDRSEHIKSVAYSDDGKYIGKFENDESWDLETFQSESRSIASDQSFMNTLSSVKVWEISSGKLVFTSQDTNKGTIVFDGDFVGVARHGIVLKAWNYLTGSDVDVTQIGSFEKKNEDDAYMLYWTSYNDSARFYGAKIKGALLSKKDHSLITSRRNSIK